jgi:hypothetical protein
MGEEKVNMPQDTKQRTRHKPETGQSEKKIRPSVQAGLEVNKIGNNIVSQERPPLQAVQGNFTQIPNEMLQSWMPQMRGEAEVKVVFYIAQHTLSFDKLFDCLSVSQFINGVKKPDGTMLDHGTGLARKNIIAGLKRAEEDGFIKTITYGKNGKEKKLYFLNHEDSAELYSYLSSTGLDPEIVLKNMQLKQLQGKYPKMFGK